MKWIDYVILAVILLILGAALWYICKAKKKGVKCIGCPDGAKCTGSCACCPDNCGGREKVE